MSPVHLLADSPRAFRGSRRNHAHPLRPSLRSLFPHPSQDALATEKVCVAERLNLNAHRVKSGTGKHPMLLVRVAGGERAGTCWKTGPLCCERSPGAPLCWAGRAGHLPPRDCRRACFGWSAVPWPPASASCRCCPCWARPGGWSVWRHLPARRAACWGRPSCTRPRASWAWSGPK